MKTVPSISFHPADYALDEVHRAWAQMFEWLHRAAPLPVPGRAFTSHVQSHVVGRLILGHGHFNAQTMTFDAQRDSVLGGEQYLIVWTLRRGRMNILHDGQIFDIGPGEVWLIDQMRDAQALITDADVQFVVCPHSAIGYDPLIHPARFHVDLESELGAALHDDLQDLLRTAPNLSLRAAPDREQSYTDLLKALVIQSRQVPDLAGALPQQIKAYADEHIFDPGLSIEGLMNRFEVPRATILEALGLPISIEQYAADRRLDYALRSLGFGARAQRRLEVLARRSGYATITDFETAFEARFGISPSIILGALSGAEAHLRSSDAMGVWDRWHGVSVP